LAGLNSICHISLHFVRSINQSVGFNNQQWASAYYAGMILSIIGIQKVTNAKYLGITFDCHLSWKSHINTIAAKVDAAQAFLHRNTTFCPTEVKIH